MSKIKNGNVLLDKDGFEITVRQALARIRSLRKWRERDPEFFELNGLWHDLLLLEQFVKLYGRWNREKCEVAALSESEGRLLSLKVERVTPETYPCGVLIKTLED